MNIKAAQKLLCGLMLSVFLLSGLGLEQPAMAKAHHSSHKQVKVVQKEEMVFFNTNSFKYHKPNCEWAQRCTVNCILIPKSEAVRRGGIPCRVCGG